MNYKRYQMNYKQIYKERKNQENGDLFIRITVYEPEDTSFPFMFAIETGNSKSEDWFTDYSLKQFYSYQGAANAIRHAINLLDAYEFPVEVEANAH